jgi:hypothetical protein
MTQHADEAQDVFGRFEVEIESAFIGMLEIVNVPLAGKAHPFTSDNLPADYVSGVLFRWVQRFRFRWA